jgi:hypothetical protein
MDSDARMKRATKLLSAPALFAAGLGLLMLPGRLKLPQYRRTSLDGVMTIGDAVDACRNTELEGWDLVTYAQHLVSQKFSIYSTRNLWDTPARAFEHGMGYCTQYNLALKQILDQLGLDSEAVFSTRVRVVDNSAWTMGHTWLRVSFDGVVRDVCAGRLENVPGCTHFVPVHPIRRGNGLVFFLTQIGVMLLCGFIEWKALLTGQDAPYWTLMEKR